MTRGEHLEWCKKRAIEYAEAGDNQNAFTSMVSDLGKHSETEKSVPIATQLGMPLLMMGKLDTEKQMIDFINGFN